MERQNFADKKILAHNPQTSIPMTSHLRARSNCPYASPRIAIRANGPFGQLLEQEVVFRYSRVLA